MLVSSIPHPAIIASFSTLVQPVPATGQGTPGFPYMNTDEIAKLVESQIDTVTVDVRSDDGTHFAALVVSSEFEGLRPLQRHQLVYAALGDKVGREIHALSIQASTPDEWQRDCSAGRG